MTLVLTGEAPPHRRGSSSATRVWRGLAIPAALTVAWLSLASGEAAGGWPSLSQVAARAAQDIQSGVLPAALVVSLWRDFQGLLLGGILGVAVGTAIGLSRLVARTTAPTLHVLKLVSPFAWIPLLMTWFGLGEGSKLAFIALVGFLPILFATIQGVSSVPAHLVELGRVQRLSEMRIAFSIGLPWAAPAIFSGVYLALISTWMGTLGAEYMLTSGGGVGAYLVQARDSFEMDRLIVGVAAVGLVGFALQAAGRAVEARALGWRVTLGESQA